jgi:hypothetical protein
MVARINPNEGTPSTGKWLLMVYVAADNNLSALFVDQLKALKDAGFAKRVEVVVRFDPNEPDLKTLTFNVNTKRKHQHGAPSIKVGDGRDPFVRDMIDDLIEAEPDDIGAPESLDRFIDSCLRKHKADHHMLFLLGHGLVVGNDSFLPDEFPKSGITLRQLGRILKTHFGEKQKRSLELLGMQACAMSAIEVLYELQGTAKYMLASEGLSFVNGWPHRQLMKRFLNGLRRRESIEYIIDRLYWLTFFNAKDFLLAGQPLELSLVSLDPEKVKKLTRQMRNLVGLLKIAVKQKSGRDAIQLAHLRSQSYFGELYTDLFDFCSCLLEECNPRKLKELGQACRRVINELRLRAKPFEGLIIHSNHFGSRSQYSHGLSIMFPWVEPRKNAKPEEQVMAMYEDYRFSHELSPDSWFSFLVDYFENTMRESLDRAVDFNDAPPDVVIDAEDEANWSRALNNALEKPTGATEKPTGGTDSSTCDCPSIKNFPREKQPGDVVIL